MNFIIEEFVEVLVPFAVTFIELFLYFGWNDNMVPQVRLMSVDDFTYSCIVKIVFGFMQLINFAIAGVCRNPV